jgi:glucosamine-6-phosphate deaminase
MVAPTPTRAFKVDSLAVEVYATQAEMAQAAATQVQASLQERVTASNAARAILASATSQIEFLAALTGAEGIDWSRVTLFHMDEYLGIGDEHPASFRRFMREHVASKLPVAAMHYLAGDADLPLAECRRYAGLLTKLPVDLCCLGIGENGHVAFNDPPVADFDDPDTVKLVKLDERCRQQQVGEGCFPNLESVPQYAYTLTVPSLLSAQRLFCIVPERRKAEAVRATLHGEITTGCPASILRRHPNATLYLDADSASLL